MNFRVYIAAPYPVLREARSLREELINCGVDVTSRWITEDSAELNDEWARKDLADVARCDVFVAFNPGGWESSGTGGRHVEFGYALALRKPIVLCGSRTNIFHHLSDVVAVEPAPSLRLLAERIHDAILHLHWTVGV